MKMAKIFLIGIAICTFAITSCKSKKSEDAMTYEVEFENLLLAPISNVLNTPDYITGCRMEIKTFDQFETDKYSEWCGILGSWSDEGYAYMWSDSSGVFRLPSGSGQITVYSNDEKILDLKYDGGLITFGEVWQEGDVVCEFEGTLNSTSENELTVYYFLEGELIWYNNDSDLYMQKKIVTEGYEPNCEQYDEITHYYYPTGVVSHKIVERHTEDESCTEGSGYSSVTMEEVYYNPDGSEMTMADRLFENHKKYLILSAGYNSINTGDFYVVLMPEGKGLTRGYGAIISSNRSNISSFIVDKTFEYRIYDNEIVCDEFFYHSRWSGTGRVQNQKRRTLEIDVDYKKDIVLTGEFIISGWRVDCNMRPIEKGYSDWLYTTLQDDFIDMR